MSTNLNMEADDTRVEVNVDSQTASKEETEALDDGNGQPKVNLTKTRLILIMIGLSLGVFLAALDQTIVTTALPAIASDFKALDQIAWVATAYLLTSTGFQPAYGKLSDIFGRKATFLFAIIVFELGSLGCGLAPNMTIMIVARAVAGIGGGGIISLVMVIITDIVSLQDSGKYQGIIGAIFGIASVVGPLLGGAFTDHVTWRWSFYINLPLGAITIAAVIFLLRLPRPKGSLLQKLKRIDYAGTIVIFIATIAILLPLNWGGSKYAWSSPIIIILLIVGGLGFLLFALVEVKYAVEPIAPPHLFKHLSLVGCYATNLFQGMAFFASVYYIPLFFQVVKGDSATKSGLELIPYVLGVVEAAIVMGQLVSRTNYFSYRTICLIGAAFITVGTGLMILWDENTGKIFQMSYMIIAGIGVGCIMQTTLLCALGIVKNEDTATITTLLNFFRLIGAVFGVAIVGTVFSNVLATSLASASIPPEYIEAVQQSSTIVHQLPEEIRGPIISAYVDALRASFITIVPFGGLTFISSIFMGNHKPKIEKGNRKTIIIE